MKSNQFQVSAPLLVGNEHTRVGNERVIAPMPLSQLMVPVISQVGARREAAQSRSQDKMARVLDATAALLDQNGAEAVTTTAVAAKAAVSVGWLYNFFDDRQSLLEEVMVTGLVDLDARLELVDFSLASPGWRDRVPAGIDIVIDFFDASPGFRSLWFSADFSGRMSQANRLHDDALADYLAASVTAIRPDAPDVPLGVVAQVFVGMLDKGLDLAYRNNPAGDKSMLTEMTRASIEYLNCYLA
jgi:AcrR family transcriptional regulator